MSTYFFVILAVVACLERLVCIGIREELDCACPHRLEWCVFVFSYTADIFKVFKLQKQTSYQLDGAVRFFRRRGHCFSTIFISAHQFPGTFARMIIVKGVLN